MNLPLPTDTPSRSIEELESQKQRVHQLISKIDTALHEGRIGAAERDALVAHYCGTADTRAVLSVFDDRIAALRHQPQDDGETKRMMMLVAGFSVIVVALFATLFYATGGITGAVVYERQYNTTYATNATLQIELNGTTRVNISGIAQGQGDVIITLIADSQQYVLYAFRHGGISTPHASLPKSIYAAGEDISYNARNVSSAYLMTRDSAIPLDTNESDQTITGLAVGDYAIKLIINDTTLSQETLAFEVVAADAPPPSETFNACGEACSVNITGNATLEIAIDGDATLQLDTVTASTGGNRAPLLTRPISDANGTGSASVDIAAAFSDPDGDALLFDSSRHDGLTETIDNGVLTVSGAPGSYTYIAYASDGKELTPSNIFTVTLEANEILNETANATGNLTNFTNTNISLNTTNATNETSFINDTNMTIDTNATLNMTDLCANPDPNLRPIECLTENASKYFIAEVFLEDVDHNKVGRLTALGNLLIRGRAYQYSAGQPGPRDFTISYDDADLNHITTIWIDKDGNLQLRGRVIEENTNLNPPPGSYAVINRKGVYLAYADTQSGDLYLRGNLIMFRDDII